MTNKRTIYIYGPHTDEYSLARVNRGILNGLLTNLDNQQYTLKIGAKPEDVSALASEKHFNRYPELRQNFEKYDSNQHYDLVIYNNFPKNPESGHGLANINAKAKIAYIAWEEDRVPQRFIDEFNSELVCLLVASDHTKMAFVRSGLMIPCIVLANALNHHYFDNELLNQLTKIAHRSRTPEFTFFHNSSGLSRKGPEVLIKAFNEEFEVHEDVKLLLKTFPNSTNEFPRLLSELEEVKKNKIEFINDPELSEEEMLELYLRSDAYVSPSKAEGFNLPVLEAMKLGIPAITTAWGGQMDFVNSENAYLVDYEIKPAKSHLDNPGANWAEPKIESLKAEMRNAFQASKEELQEKIDLAKQTADAYSWQDTTKNLVEIINLISEIKFSNLKTKKLAVLTPINTSGGIAEYSSYLYSGMQKFFDQFFYIANSDTIANEITENVERLWQTGDKEFIGIEKFIKENEIDFTHIQYNLGFFSLDNLGKLIKKLSDTNKVLLTPHSVSTPGFELKNIKEALETASQIHVLKTDDAKSLKTDTGLKNIINFPHGNITFTRLSKDIIQEKLGINSSTPIIATHGFMVPNKGFMASLDAIAKLKVDYPDILYLAINAVNPNNVDSADLAAKFNSRISELELNKNVIHVDDFLDREEILVLLSAADVVMFPYSESKEAASGAVRLALATERPLLYSNTSQLSDLVENQVGKVIDDNAPNSIVTGIKSIIENKKTHHQIQKSIRSYSDKHNWDLLKLCYLKYLSDLIS